MLLIACSDCSSTLVCSRVMTVSEIQVIPMEIARLNYTMTTKIEWVTNPDGRLGAFLSQLLYNHISKVVAKEPPSTGRKSPNAICVATVAG